MSLTPLISHIEIKARYGNLVMRSGIFDDATLDDIAAGAVALIKKRLGYNPQIDSVPSLPSVTETLDGGRPVIVLLAPIDTVSNGVQLVVTELGATLTRRTSFPTPPTQPSGDYIIGEDCYTLYRLSGSSARQLGIWGASSSAVNSLSYLGSGGGRLQADYTDRYRGVIQVTYTPEVDLALFRRVALKLARLELIEAVGGISVKDGDQSIQFASRSEGLESKESILAELPRPILIGTGT
jgi:hypothetical protein